jgi:uncharacterized membrane protein
MNMVYCRGCGKEIHESAPTCPQCGAINNFTVKTQNQQAYHWSSITSFVTGVVVILMAMTLPDGKWDSDTVLGGIIFGAIPTIFGVISISHSYAGRWMAITGVVFGVIMLLASLGSI